MADALEAPQEYKFQPHEFKDVNPKEKGGYWFTMEVYKGKAQNNIKGSVVAQDLLLILQKSGRALEMFETAKFEFTLDKQFLFCVSQEPVVEETEDSENAVEAGGNKEETVEEVAAEAATEEASSEEAESPEEVKEEVKDEEAKEEEVKEEAEAEKKEG